MCRKFPIYRSIEAHSGPYSFCSQLDKDIENANTNTGKKFKKKKCNPRDKIVWELKITKYELTVSIFCLFKREVCCLILLIIPETERDFKPFYFIRDK